MPYPFTRAEETQRTPGTTRGVRLTLPDKTLRFFPGSSAQLALILAGCVVPNSLLEHPQTVIEFGSVQNNAFIMEEIVKSAVEPVEKVTPEKESDLWQKRSTVR